MTKTVALFAPILILTEQNQIISEALADLDYPLIQVEDKYLRPSNKRRQQQ